MQVHASNLHGADAPALKAIRDRHFPHGELDDGGGAIPPMAAGLLPSDGRDAHPIGSHPEDFGRIDAFVDCIPASLIEAGVLVFADHIQVWAMATMSAQTCELHIAESCSRSIGCCGTFIAARS
jgi:hypothetical protein